MGIAFHLSENVVWVTAAEGGGNTGPKMVTRIYKLRTGYVPSGITGRGQGETGFGERAVGGLTFGGGDTGQAGGSADTLIQVLNEFLVDNPDTIQDSKFAVYRDRNLLLIRNTVENIRLAEKLIKEFDVVPMQILIEARFLTISENDLLQLGTEINDLNHAHGVEDPSVRFVNQFAPFANAAGGSALSLSGIIDHFTYDIVISAFERLSSAKTLSAPRITVINNHSARIRRGDVRFYFDEFEQETTGGDNPATSTVPTGEAQELELGITFEVTPTIGHNKKEITLSLNAEIVDFIEFVSVTPDISLPRTNETTINTTVSVNSTNTVILGGVITSNKTENVDAVPLLAKIPIISFFFKKTEKNASPTHLLIFVTATLVDPAGNFNRTETEEETDKK